MGKAENATRKAQMNKILWGYSRGRGSFWLGDQGNFGSFKLKKKKYRADIQRYGEGHSRQRKQLEQRRGGGSSMECLRKMLKSSVKLAA